MQSSDLTAVKLPPAVRNTAGKIGAVRVDDLIKTEQLTYGS